MAYKTKRKLRGNGTRSPMSAAMDQRYTKLQVKLAKSLACYVTESDWLLDRQAFISMVSSRIRADIAAGTY